jgi:linoleoyl-CoA desaturase
MEKINFKAGPELHFFHTLRKRVDAYFKDRNLSKKANAAMVLKSAILLCAYILPFILLLMLPMPFGVAVLIWVILGAAMAGIGMSIMHDANHGAYAGRKVWNKILGHTINIIGGISANWKIQHNKLHHTYTNISGADQDIETGTILRFSPHSRHRKLYKYQWWYAFLFYSISTIYWVVVKDFKQAIEYRKRGLLRGTSRNYTWLLARLVGIKSIYFFMFFGVTTLTGIPFWQALTGFIIMHLACGIILSVIFQMAHVVEETRFPQPDRHGSMEDSWAAHQLRTTMNFACGNKWLSWYIGGLNFQVEHHLFANICHVHYPAIAPIVKRTANEFGLPYLEKRTFGNAFHSHIRLLKTLGRAPSLDDIMG